MFLVVYTIYSTVFALNIPVDAWADAGKKFRGVKVMLSEAKFVAKWGQIIIELGKLQRFKNLSGGSCPPCITCCIFPWVDEFIGYFPWNLVWLFTEICSGRWSCRWWISCLRGIQWGSHHLTCALLTKVRCAPPYVKYSIISLIWSDICHNGSI
jgi:hypothetical protein